MKLRSVLSAALLAACAGDKASTDDPTGDDDDDTIDTGGPPVGELPEVYINEFMASNTLTVADELGAFPDWVELYNAGDTEADLSGFWMTDDNTNIFNHEFADGTVIPAGGFLLLFADGDVEEGPTHLNFSLSAASEDIGLYGRNVDDNPRIDSLDDYGVQAPDISLARSPDGSPTFVVDDTPTPGTSNGG